MCLDLGLLVAEKQPAPTSTCLVMPSNVRYQIYRCVRPKSDCISSSWSQCDEPFSKFMHVQQCMLNNLAPGRAAVRHIQQIR